MSGPLARSEGPANDTGSLPARYKVGYAKPPAEHRFQKGRSGTPGGRPRGAKNKSKPLDPIPHPDDVHIDMRTGKVSLEGPADEHEKQMQDGALARRDEAQEEVNYFAERYRRAKSEERKDRYLEDWHWEQRMFDLINDAMQSRYKARLENRCFAPGASREGETLADVSATNSYETNSWGDRLGSWTANNCDPPRGIPNSTSWLELCWVRQYQVASAHRQAKAGVAPDVLLTGRKLVECRFEEEVLISLSIEKRGRVTSRGMRARAFSDTRYRAAVQTATPIHYECP